MSVAELYEHSIKSLPAAERLRLAQLILDNIPARSIVDYSEEWTDQDLQDLSRASLQRWNAEEDAPDA